MVKPEETAYQRAYSFHKKTLAQIEKELSELDVPGDKPLSVRLRIRHLKAEYEVEVSELNFVEQAHDKQLDLADEQRAKRELTVLQRDDRRQTILNLVKVNLISGQKQLISLLIQQGFQVTGPTLSRDLRELNIVRYRPGPNESVRYVQVVQNEDDELNSEKLAEFALANAAGFALQNLTRKDDRLYLECTNRTAGHLTDALYERSLPDVVSIMSDNHSTIWIEMTDEISARQLETLLGRFLVFGG